MDRAKGYIGMSGIYALPKLVARYPEYRAQFLVSAFGADEGKWAGDSPIHDRFPAGARWLIIHCPGDELVELRQSDDLVHVLRDQKIPVELVTPKGTHFQVPTDLGAPGTVETKAVLGFIAGKPR